MGVTNFVDSTKKTPTFINDEITGIKVQYLKIILANLKENNELFVYSNDIEIAYNKKMISDDGDIQIELEIPKDCKEIRVCCLSGKCLIDVYRLKISYAFKIRSLFKKIFSIINRSIIVFGRGMRFLWREHRMMIPPTLWRKYFIRFFSRVKERGEILWNPFIQDDYYKWIQKFEKNNIDKEQEYNPLISILIPVYNVERKFLSECLDSILNQTYQNYEVCIVDDCSTNLETINTLKEYENKDTRIVVKTRLINGHISKASNDALEIARGEFICLVDNDDTLAPNALYENVALLNKHKDADFIYSDEDKLDLRGERCEPHFKSDFAPDTLLGINYICHLAVLRTSLVREVGGFTVGLEGVQDHDLFLRITEKTKNIYHIPKILYHWRMIEGSTSLSVDNKAYAVKKGIETIESTLKRRGVKANVKSLGNSTVYGIEYVLDTEPSVSIIVPTRDFADVTEKCLESIYKLTNYSNFEVVIVDNRSEKQETMELFEKYQMRYENFRVIKADMEFNYSAINNLAVNTCKSDVLVLLNNDTEVLTPNWLKLMVSYAIQKHIGAVGAKLLYPDMTIQHGGVLLGVGNAVAAHAFISHPRDDEGVYGRLKIPYNYSAVTAACLAVERKKYIQVGGLDETLKVAYNDVDFNLKLLDAGYYNLFIPQVELIHYESKSRGLDSTSEKYKQFLAENNYMHKKWAKYIECDPYYNKNLSKLGLYMLNRNID